MYDINLKNIKKGYSFGLIFFIIGLFMFLAFLIVPLIALNKQKNYDSETTAISVEYTSYRDDEGDTMYKPIYTYDVDGVRYTCKSSYSSGSKNASINDLIYYKSSDPNDCITEYDMKGSKMFLYFTALPGLFVVIGIIFILYINKKVKKAKYLADHGTLVKNLPFTMVESNVSVNNRSLLAIAVDYTFPDGITRRIVGEPRYDHQMSDQDGLVDLLIDPNDPTNYYIDFNINPKY